MYKLVILVFLMAWINVLYAAYSLYRLNKDSGSGGADTIKQKSKRKRAFKSKKKIAKYKKK